MKSFLFVLGFIITIFTLILVATVEETYIKNIGYVCFIIGVLLMLLCLDENYE